MEKVIVNIYPAEKKVLLMNENKNGHKITMHTYKEAMLFLSIHFFRQYMKILFTAFKRKANPNRLIETFINL